MKILITDHGLLHSPQKFADATAAEITPFDDSLSGERLEAAQALRKQFAAILLEQHDRNQQQEFERLKIDSAYIHEAHDAAGLADDSVLRLIEAIKGTPFEFLWNRAEVQAIAREIIDSHMKSSQHLVRLQFAADHADNPDGQHYQSHFNKVHV